MYIRKLIGFLVGACLWGFTGTASAQTPVTQLDYDGAIELARQSAPALQVARARAAEAGSAVESARVRTFNPQILGAVGPRFDPEGDTTDWNIAFRQWMELGGQRGDRIEAAHAGAEAGAARSDDRERTLLREVGFAFVEALYWQERLTIARENQQIAQGIAQVAEKRHGVGDGSGLDASVSAVALARAAALVNQTEVSLTRAEGRLESLLGLDPTGELVCTGMLSEVAQTYDAPSLDERADLRALRAESQGAQAQLELSRARRIPNMALGARYSREEGANIVQGTLIVTLPVADRGQGDAAQARARAQRIDAELEATRRSASVEIDTARQSARELQAAAESFEREGLEASAKAQKQATAAYEAGSIPMGELLALRRELLAAELDHIDLLFAAARARVELQASLGAKP
jgi:cobalt-zinc-cadmium efflux system outer membrane protein